jgi:hypoxanthine phosphoribosyltransferase
MDVLIPADRIAARVDELAGEIARTYSGQPVTILGVLTGSVVFLADLIRRIDAPIRIGFLKASSYRGETTYPGHLDLDVQLLPDVAGHHVLVLDDILDTGNTISRVVNYLKGRGATSVRTCMLLRKLGRQVVPFTPDFVGFEIPDRFVIGYGLDYNDHYRHLPFIGVLPTPAAE